MPPTPEPSMLPSFLMLLLFGGAAAAVFVWNQRKLARRGVVASQSFREFLEQTGFRVVGAERADLGQQAELALRALGQEGGESGQEWVRDCSGVEVRHFFRRVQKNNSNYYWCRWSAPLRQPPRIGLQVIERRLIGKQSLVDNFIENKSYEWRQLFPHQVPLADPELDKRFVVYGNDPALVLTALGANGVRDSLLACKQVDLSVGTDGVVFSDPFRENILAALGGGTGLLMMGYDPRAMTQMILPVHDRVSWLAASLARACT
ncbi:MAG TPA: hypothetical protein VHP33_24170 [Polyangiaceae bacterium]|nr:hypothetical protein [Polyangiaceae bacterium]